MSWISTLIEGLREPSWQIILYIIMAAIALWLLLPPRKQIARVAGGIVGLIALSGLVALAPRMPVMSEAVVFWIFACVTIVASVATVTMTNPVYSAIWFAFSLLTTAILFMYQGAQFLAVAIVAVYAGAIVVTFLFVLMLSQPEGRASYDRLSWGRFPPIVSIAVASAILVVLTFTLSRVWQDGVGQVALGEFDQGGFREQVAETLVAVATDTGEEIDVQSLLRADLRSTRTGPVLTLVFRHPPLPTTAAEDFDKLRLVKVLARDPRHWPYLPDGLSFEVEVIEPQRDVLATAHVAHLGTELYSRHILSVEIVGTLLLIALVGAIAILIQGKHGDDAREGPEDG